MIGHLSAVSVLSSRTTCWTEGVMNPRSGNRWHCLLLIDLWAWYKHLSSLKRSEAIKRVTVTSQTNQPSRSMVIIFWMVCARCAAHMLYQFGLGVSLQTPDLFAVLSARVLQRYRTTSVQLHTRSWPYGTTLCAGSLCSCAGGGDIAVVDTESRAAWRKHSLLSFQIGWRRLESLSHNEKYRVVTLLLFLAVLHHTRI